MDNYLLTASIPSLMKHYSLPCITGLLVAALYNIVDQLFIANASYLGSYGNAANTVVFPLTVVALAVAVMIGDGACAYISLSLGSKDEERARKSMGSAVTLALLSSLVIVVLYLVFANELITLFGGKVNSETESLSREYFFYITIGLPFYIFGQAMNPIIRSDKSPKFAMVSTLLGALINIVLDPVFIFLFRWGMMGAALATVIGQAVTALLALWYLFNLKSFKLKRSDFLIRGGIVSKYIPLGICSLLSQLSLVAAMAAINNMIRVHGARDPIFSDPELSQIPMAVVGIVMKFFQIVISIVVGMAAGCIPVVGFNLGAGRKDRVKELFKLLLLFESFVGIVAFIIVEFFPTHLIRLFGSANESVYYTSFAIKAFRIYLSMIIPSCVNKATFIYLQAMGNAILATTLSMVREVIFGVGFALLLPQFFELDGVLYSMPVSDILTFLLSAISIGYVMRKLSI
ncbi:MAG: MATE family efflux transporter [Sphaerochaetaceae bacterium]|nr:MATE family efflux transporter [Sphaerochaetaceae bacterium]